MLCVCVVFFSLFGLQQAEERKKENSDRIRELHECRKCFCHLSSLLQKKKKKIVPLAFSLGSRCRKYNILNVGYWINTAIDCTFKDNIALYRLSKEVWNN